MLFLSPAIFPQKTQPNSPVFRDYKPPDSSRIFKRVDNSYQLWQSFLLIKEANDANPLAEHELGIRYLTGDGFPVDTPKAIYWIKKAADQNLPAANYNYAIFLHNGWGVHWDPFEAYRRFIKAASSGMIEAEYVTGLLLTDNLVVARDLSRAYKYLKSAASKGFKPASEVLREFHKRGIGIGLDSSLASNFQADSLKDNTSNGNIVDASWGINYLGFENDSLAQVDDKTLLNEVLKAGKQELKNAIGQDASKGIDSLFSENETSLEALRKAGEAGSPEALTLLGRCYERGLGVKKDIVLATVEYIKSIRQDSPKGSRLLWNLMQQKGYFDILKAGVDRKDPASQFAYAALSALHFSQMITEADAVKLLEESSNANYPAAIDELGLCYFTGNMVSQNKQKGIDLWRRSEKLSGSRNAQVRLAVANIQGDQKYEDLRVSVKKLQDASNEGSLMAQVALGLCYEKGIGLRKDISKAIHLYRLSAQRGSQGAYRALRSLYDNIRPADEIFSIHGDE